MSSDTGSPVTILLVGNDPTHENLAQAALQPPPARFDWRLTHVETLGAACSLAEPPDLVLLDLTLPDSQGLDTLRRLRERFAFVPVVALTGAEDTELEAATLGAGAQDFLGRDEMTPRTLRRVVRYAMERHRAERALLELSTRDELTGLLNRRGFFMSAQPIVRLAEREGREFAVLLADLDGLEAINDAHGQPAGDEALRDAGRILTQTFRSADVVARIGGDEFAILAPGAAPETIGIMLQRVAKWQEERNRAPGRRCDLSLTVAGVAWTPNEPRTLDMLISEADMAVYAAKRRR